MNWFAKDFPKPKKTIMTLEEIDRYWKRLDRKWRVQCQIFVYRIRKPENSPKPMLWKIPKVLDPEIPTASDILRVLGVPGEVNDPYTIRIVREWETSPGMSKKEEICIANFQLTMSVN